MNSGHRAEVRAAGFLVWAAALLTLAAIGYCVRMALKIDIMLEAVHKLWSLVH